MKPERETGPIRTRFVVDILRDIGGGLNSIFGEGAGRGWTRSDGEAVGGPGGYRDALNDGKAVTPVAGGFTLKQQKLPQSLLSSERMYALLLSALGEMDGKPSKLRWWTRWTCSSRRRIARPGNAAETGR